MAARFRRHPDGALPKNDKEGSRHKKRVKIRWLSRRHSQDFQKTWFDTEGLLLWRSVKDKLYRQHRSLELQGLWECAFKVTAFVLFHLLNRTCHEVLARCRWQPRNLWILYLIFAKKLERGGVRQNTTVLYPTLLCWRRHVSVTVGHLQVIKMYIEENYTEFDHSIGAYCKVLTRSRCRLDYTYWAKSTSSK